MVTCVTRTCYVTSWVEGRGVLTFMLTCATCTCYVTSWVGGAGCQRSCLFASHAHATSGFPLAGIIIVGCAQMFLFWDIKVASAKRGGKPPPESAARIPASQALNFVKQSPGQKKMFITDGAPCYPSLSLKFGWRHEACNKLFWFTQVGSMRCGGYQNRPYEYHVVLRPESTGMWAQNWCEASGCDNGVGGTPNQKTFWRSLVALKKRMAMWEDENIARVFKSKFPVNCRTSSKIHFKFLGNRKPILWNESIVSLWRTRHFFQNARNRWRGFPPDGLFMFPGCLFRKCLQILQDIESWISDLNAF